jgi:N-terminal EH-domain containing protein/Dynamin family
LHDILDGPGSIIGMDLKNSFRGGIDKDLVFDGLKNMYLKKILPLEIASKYSNFNTPPLRPSDFDARPMVLILGQYSVGKTSFIRSLLKSDFPGMRVGPEPTTDRFTAIMYSSDTQDSGRLSPGHALGWLTNFITLNYTKLIQSYTNICLL